MDGLPKQLFARRVAAAGKCLETAQKNNPCERDVTSPSSVCWEGLTQCARRRLYAWPSDEGAYVVVDAGEA